jgi:transcription antitermination factor NusA-like protein
MESMDERDRDGPSLKRQRPGDSSVNSITILVDAELIHFIVGKGGSNIRQLEADFQVRIQCERPGSADRSVERPVVISSSSIENKVMAVRSITEIIINAKQLPQAIIKLVIPAEAGPVIIGKQGSSVKQLMTTSGAHIDVLRDGERVVLPAGLTGSRLCAITGSLDSSCSALSMIAHRLAELEGAPGLGSMMGRPGPQVDSYRGQAPFMRIDPHPPASSMYMAGDMGLMRNGDMGLMRNGDMGLMRSSEMGLMRNSEMGLMRNSEMGLMRSSGNSYAGSVPPFPQPPQPPVSHHGRDRERSSRAQPACTLNMFVPAGIVRLVIGKAGANIKEVIRQCDELVTINVEREGDASGPMPPEICAGTSMRSVVIKGPPSLVLKAAYIIQDKVCCEYDDLQWTVVAMHPPGGEHAAQHGEGGHR